MRAYAPPHNVESMHQARRRAQRKTALRRAAQCFGGLYVVIKKFT